MKKKNKKIKMKILHQAVIDTADFPGEIRDYIKHNYPDAKIDELDTLLLHCGCSGDCRTKAVGVCLSSRKR